MQPEWAINGRVHYIIHTTQTCTLLCNPSNSLRGGGGVNLVKSSIASRFPTSCREGKLRSRCCPGVLNTEIAFPFTIMVGLKSSNHSGTVRSSVQTQYGMKLSWSNPKNFFQVQLNRHDAKASIFGFQQVKTLCVVDATCLHDWPCAIHAILRLLDFLHLDFSPRIRISTLCNVSLYN